MDVLQDTSVNDQNSKSVPSAPRKKKRKPSLLITWVALSAFIVAAAYMQQAGLLRLAVLTQLLSGYDVYATKRFDVPRLPPSKNFEIIAAKGGKLSAIALRGNYAYIGAGESLMIVDVSNPHHLQVIGSILLLGQISDIELEGHYAYVCNGRGGLRIVDVTNAEKPKEVAAYGYMATPKHACVTAGCAYIAAGMRGLEVLDVRNPIRPVAVSFEDSAGKSGTLDAKSICLDDDRLCVIDEDQGLRLFDLKNPYKPSKIGEWKAGGRGLRRGAAAVEGKTMVIAGDSPDEGVSLLNIKGNKPVLDSSLDVPPYWYGTCTKIHEGFAYVGTSSGLLIVDIHDKKKPVRICAFDKVKGIMDLVVKDNTVYATTASGDLCILDVSDPFTPVVVSNNHLGGDSHHLAFIDGKLYSTAGPSGIQSYTLPIGDKALPDVQAFDFKNVRAVAQSGNDIIVSDERFTSNSARISLVTLLRQQTDGKFKEIWSQTIDKSEREVAGSTEFVFAAADDGIHIFNKAGNQRYFHPLKTGADLMCASGAYLYVVTDTGPNATRLITFEAKDPEHLKQVSQIVIDQRAYALATDSRHVYILEGGLWGDRELSILNTTTGGALQRAGSLKIKQADRLAIDGNRAYVQGFMEVNSVDISDANNPKLVGTVDLSAIPLAASDIKAKNGTVYIAGQDGGIYVLKDKTLK